MASGVLNPAKELSVLRLPDPLPSSVRIAPIPSGPLLGNAIETYLIIQQLLLDPVGLKRQPQLLPNRYPLLYNLLLQ